MSGYWGRPAETADALRDGWLRTGDVATVDVEGYVTIVDRRKDIIVSGGENVSSVQVEVALAAHRRCWRPPLSGCLTNAGAKSPGPLLCCGLVLRL